MWWRVTFLCLLYVLVVADFVVIAVEFSASQPRCEGSFRASLDDHRDQSIPARLLKCLEFTSAGFLRFTYSFCT